MIADVQLTISLGAIIVVERRHSGVQERSVGVKRGHLNLTIQRFALPLCAAPIIIGNAYHFPYSPFLLYPKNSLPCWP